MRESMQSYCLNMFRASMWPDTSSEQCTLLASQCSTTKAASQVWPPKSGSYLLIVLLMMGILMLETCWGNKTAYFVASSWLFTFHYRYYNLHQFFYVCCFVHLGNKGNYLLQLNVHYRLYNWPWNSDVAKHQYKAHGINTPKPKTYGCINYSSASDDGRCDVRSMLSEQ
jgi:hypothetical protein